jgi:hypothetical protein
MRTLGPIRTAVLRFRKPPLFPLSYEGLVRTERLELPEHEGNRVTAGPTSPSVARPLGWLSGIEPPPLEPQSSALQLSYSHSARTWTRTRDTRCVEPVLLPLSYTGEVRRVGIEPTAACS